MADGGYPMASDDAAARKERAEAIRRRRDRYNRAPADTSTPSPGAADAPTLGDDRQEPGGPNYAAWIDKKMRDEP
jgi:hypothetical protein